MRDALFGQVVTYSPKVFLPLTNLCRNHCDYCSFRRSPGDPGEWTMTPAEIEAQLVRARELGCAEALFCLGDKPEKAFSAYRRTLASLGQTSTVEYLHWAGTRRSTHGLLPHTNAGLLTDADMIAAQGSEREPRADARVRRARASASPGCRTTARPTSGPTGASR